jgi:hypothetical protein
MPERALGRGWDVLRLCDLGDRRQVRCRRVRRRVGVDLFLVICPDITVMTDLDDARPDCATSAAVATAATMIDRAMVILNPPRSPPFL